MTTCRKRGLGGVYVSTMTDKLDSVEAAPAEEKGGEGEVSEKCDGRQGGEEDEACSDKELDELLNCESLH